MRPIRSSAFISVERRAWASRSSPGSSHQRRGLREVSPTRASSYEKQHPRDRGAQGNERAVPAHVCRRAAQGRQRERDGHHRPDDWLTACLSTEAEWRCPTQVSPYPVPMPSLKADIPVEDGGAMSARVSTKGLM